MRDMKHEKRNAKTGKKEAEAKRQVVFTIQNPPVLPRTKVGARPSPGAETLKVSSCWIRSSAVVGWPPGARERAHPALEVSCVTSCLNPVRIGPITMKKTDTSEDLRPRTGRPRRLDPVKPESYRSPSGVRPSQTSQTTFFQGQIVNNLNQAEGKIITRSNSYELERTPVPGRRNG